MPQRDDIYVWVDLEMTGLDPESCAIVQMAMVLTDSELNEVSEPWEVTIWQPAEVLERMDPFVRNMHQHSGLLPQISASQVSVADAQRQAMKLLTAHSTYRTGRLAGNSVWQDRRFLNRYMPNFDDYLHYRLIDVSTLKELAERWYKTRFDKPSDGAHTALFDIQQSIAELKFYRQNLLR